MGLRHSANKAVESVVVGYFTNLDSIDQHYHITNLLMQELRV